MSSERIGFGLWTGPNRDADQTTSLCASTDVTNVFWLPLAYGRYQCFRAAQRQAAAHQASLNEPHRLSRCYFSRCISRLPGVSPRKIDGCSPRRRTEDGRVPGSNCGETGRVWGPATLGLPIPAVAPDPPPRSFGSPRMCPCPGAVSGVVVRSLRLILARPPSRLGLTVH